MRRTPATGGGVTAVGRPNYARDVEIDAARPLSIPGADLGRVTVVLDVAGMHCQSCAALIEETLARDPGVQRVVVDLDAGRASVVYDPDAVSVSAVCAALRSVGYSAVPVAAGDPSS
jgi:copper chaperone CopZ